LQLLSQTDHGRAIEDVYEGVHDGPILGEGVAGVVRKVKHRDTGVYFAVKVLNLGLVESNEVLERLREEIFTMCQLDHPNILRLEEVYESETQIFLIQGTTMPQEFVRLMTDQKFIPRHILIRVWFTIISTK
jgi:serine/threonine protein kinase